MKGSIRLLKERPHTVLETVQIPPEIMNQADVFMKEHIISVFWMLAFFSLAFGQDPAVDIRPDSAQTAESVSTIPVSPNIRGFNPAVAMIRCWQAISFRTRLIECQFDPRCSEYGIQAFEKCGFFKAVLLIADRIARCHPVASRYYPAGGNGLSDPFHTISIPRSGAVTWLTIPVSLAVPGFHKMVNGRFYDGLFMFLITGTAGTETAMFAAYKNLFCIPTGIVFLAFYASDVYFNFLSLKDRNRVIDVVYLGL